MSSTGRGSTGILTEMTRGEMTLLSGTGSESEPAEGAPSGRGAAEP